MGKSVMGPLGGVVVLLFVAISCLSWGANALVQGFSGRAEVRMRQDRSRALRFGVQTFARDAGPEVASERQGALKREAFHLRHVEDWMATVVVNVEADPVLIEGSPPESNRSLFLGEPGVLRCQGAYCVLWSRVGVDGADLGRVAVVTSTAGLLRAGEDARQASVWIYSAGTLAFLVSVFGLWLASRRRKRVEAERQRQVRAVEEVLERTRTQLYEQEERFRVLLERSEREFVTVERVHVLLGEDREEAGESTRPGIEASRSQDHCRRRRVPPEFPRCGG